MPLSEGLQRRFGALLTEAEREMRQNDLRATSIFVYNEKLERPAETPDEIPGTPVAFCHLVCGTGLVLDVYSVCKQLYAELAKRPGDGGKAGPTNAWILDHASGTLTRLDSTVAKGDA